MLTGKQKRYLRSLAQTMPSTFRIGKEGVSENMIIGIDQGLEAHEIMKIKMLDNCAQDLKEAAQMLCEGTDSELVQIIGHTIILYRRSIENPQITLPR